MANPNGNRATLVKPFTSESARAASLKGHAERRALVAARLSPAIGPLEPKRDSRINSTLLQLETLDAQLSDALDKRNLKRAAALAGIKAKLWPLASPTAGQLRPGRSRRAEMPMMPEPVPMAAPVVQAAPVPPPSTPQEPAN